MQIRQLFAATLIAMFCHTIASPAFSDEKVPSLRSGKKPIALRKYLAGQGEKLGVYFTIERIASTKSRRSRLAVPRIMPEDASTVDALVKKLNDDLAGVKVVRSKHNPSVIHLTEKALDSVDGYVVSTKATVNYSGTLYGLLKEMKGIGPIKIGGMPAPPEDYTTTTTVDADNESVRKILTDAVPLKGYSRIIWDAETLKIDGKYTTQVRFSGRKTPAED